MTPLFAAAQEGHTDIVKRLIAAGANVNAARDYGVTQILIANDHEIVQD